jgi:Ca2+-binding RTX toxin-like protein
VLSGGAGDDLLGGEAGRDVLAGGFGRDQFEFSRNDDRDTIVDFADDADTIVLGARLGVTSKADALSRATVVDGNTVFTFNTGDVLIVENIADPSLLRDDLDIL